MADIFLSYAREDVALAEELATAFEQRAWTVFWDRIVPPGGTWAEILERELAAAGCVVVLWSKSSVKSDWVSIEASTARERGVLIPAFIEDVNAPLEFSRIQAADLSKWKPGGSDTELEALAGAISSKVGGMQAAELQTLGSTIETRGATSGKPVGAPARIRELRGSKRADLEAVQFPLLGRNDRGEWVAALQTELERVGLELGSYAVDGFFGPDTEHAVRRFQSQQGLDVDGVVGPETWLEFLVS